LDRGRRWRRQASPSNLKTSSPLFHFSTSQLQKMNLHLHPFDLQLKHTFTTSHGSRTVQPTVVVELEDGGVSGYGEAAATSYYGLTQKGMMEILENLRPIVESTPLNSPEQYWERMYVHLKRHPFELCALDMAANDLFARQQGMPLYQLWGLDADNLPMTNYTIGIANTEEMVAKIKEMPWPLYKIKLGTDHDLEIVRELRRHTDAVFRVDANTGWTAEQTVALAPELKDLGVEFIEQPLKAGDWEGMKFVYERCALPVIADESCQQEADVEQCYGYFHGVNVKLTKCGGLTPARRMIEKARSLGMKVMVGCMTESSVGISAIAHLLPLLDYVDMDGALLLKEDIATGVCIDNGKVFFPRENGTGVTLLR
jgi:L-Ala-D/L-Glu epimerase